MFDKILINEEADRMVLWNSEAAIGAPMDLSGSLDPIFTVALFKDIYPSLGLCNKKELRNDEEIEFNDLTGISFEAWDEKVANS